MFDAGAHSADMVGDCTLVATPHPFAAEPVYAQVRAGQTIAQMLGAGVSHTARVTIEGYDVPRQLWARVRPKAGKRIHVVLYPQGGNAGKWIKIILVVVISYFTFGAGAPAAAAALGISTTALEVVGLVAILAVNALIPPPTPKGLNGGNAAGDPFQQLNQITGTSNQANPYGVIPCVVGTYRFYPCHAALPYTEISGDQQYLRMLLDLGLGSMDISDIQIGSTPITSYDDVEYQVSTAPTLFTQDIYEMSVGTDLTDNTNDTRTTQASSEEISLDLIFNQGLFGIDQQNKTLAATAKFEVLYEDVNNPGVWMNAVDASGLTYSNSSMSTSTPFVVINSSDRKTLRCGMRWKVPTGQYNVKVSRGQSSWPGAISQGQVGVDCIWSVLRSFSHQLPSTSGTTKLAIRIKATDQLNGVISNLSVLAAQKIRTWDKATQTFTAITETQNPAWIYGWLLTKCPAVTRRLADSRVDWDGIADWAAECDAKGYKTSFVMDSGRAFSDILRDVLAAGRASFGFRNGLYSAVRDIQQTVPVQMFTPANSWGFTYSRAFVDLPHALRCKFVNPQANYKQDYVNVYADGYNADGSGGLTAATRFEELDLGPVVDPDAAWRLGMYHLSVIYNRPTQYTFSADIEHMVCERGDLVTVAHDITGWGTAWGRIRALDAVAKTVTLDGPVTLDSGKSYRIRARTVSGSTDVQDTANITNAAGDWTVLTLDVALSASVGDLFIVGEVASDVASLIVRQIEPGPDLTAKITCVDAAPAVWTADSGTPPVFVSNITGDIFCEAPPAPSIDIIESNQYASGTNDAGVTTPLVQIGINAGVSQGVVRPGKGGGGSGGNLQRDLGWRFVPTVEQF